MLLEETKLPDAKRIRRPDIRCCPHCSAVVSYKTFKRHKRLYYNSYTSVWHISSHEVSGECSNLEESPPGSVESVLSNESGHHVQDVCVLSPPLSDPADDLVVSDSTSSSDCDSERKY